MLPACYLCYKLVVSHAWGNGGIGSWHRICITFAQNLFHYPLSKLHTVYNSCLVNYITNPNSNEYKLTAIVLDIAGHILFKPSVFSGVRVTRSLVLCVCFVDRYLSFCTFSFGHCFVCSSPIYGFWLPPFGIFKLFFNISVVICDTDIL